LLSASLPQLSISHRNSGINPIRPSQYRVNESLLDYAHREQNRNSICQFSDGIEPERFFFIALLEHSEEGLTSPKPHLFSIM